MNIEGNKSGKTTSRALLSILKEAFTQISTSHNYIIIFIMPANIHQEAVGNLVATADVVSNHIHAESTKATYNGRLIKFIMFLYCNDKRNLLKPQLVDELEQAYATDRRKKSTSFLACRNVIQKWLKRLDMDHSASSPINIDGEGENVLDYDTIALYFNTMQKKVVVNRNLALKFKRKIKELQKDASEDNDEEAERESNFQIPEADDNGEVPVNIRLEISSYDGFRSAISYLYTETGVEMNQDMKLRLARYIKGSARINLAAKTILGLKIVEGKAHMTLPVYELIAKKLFQSNKPEHIMAHTFFVLDWNLMKRAENIVDANISHIRWENDSLVFHFAKSKGHQDGEFFIL